MVLTADHIAPIVALIAGILILIMPRLLNYIVAIYLIVVGLIGLNGIYKTNQLNYQLELVDGFTGSASLRREVVTAASNDQ